MTQTGNGTITAMEAGNGPTAPKQNPPPTPNSKLRRKLRPCCFATVLVLVGLAIVILVLALTVFRTRSPQTTLVSARVTGVSPRVSLPAVRIELNITLDLHNRIRNPNYASFRHDAGKSLIFYRGVQVGEADVEPGRIPSRGSADLRSRLTLEADNLLPEVGSLIGDIMAGEVGLDSRTRIPGRVTILGIFKRHAVATIDCHVAVGFPSLKIQRQDCKQKTKT
ncbi:hypothetical protein ACLOJK_031564 [Asimina triloba]